MVGDLSLLSAFKPQVFVLEVAHTYSCVITHCCPKGSIIIMGHDVIVIVIVIIITFHDMP